MIDHYNAFISYKHGDVDNKIAASIQRDLEQFHIPHRIKEKTGVKKIDRIFRDKDELPITSDLSGEIAHALENSDYLIVICSTHTKESMWVPREIQYFLRNHTRAQILTVLVDGDPQEVVPEILTYEDRYYMDAYGQKQIIRVPLEPLSCDYRIPYKRAKKEELPRLAATLVGCSYDELMRRRRQYQMRRLTIAAAAVMSLGVAFGGYMAFSRAKIKENYETSLINRSKYLANESIKLEKDERRLEALQLAMATFPNEKNPDLPVTSEALRALTKATLAYTPYSGVNLDAEWNYSMPYYVRDIKSSPNDKTFAALDGSGNVRVWDTATHKCVLSLDGSDVNTSYIQYIDDNIFITWDSEKLTAYDVYGGAMWTYECEDFITCDKLCSGNDNSVYVSTYKGVVEKINLTDGKLMASYSIAEESEDDWFSSTSISNFALSPNGKKLAIIYSPDYASSNLAVYDVDANKFEKIEMGEAYIRNVIWYDDINLAVAISGSESLTSYSMSDMSYYIPSTTIIKCFNANEMKEAWTYTLSHSSVSYNQEFFIIENKLVYYDCEMCVILDPKTGKEISLVDANDSIIKMGVNSANKPVMVTVNGNMVTASENNDAIAIKHFPSDIHLAEYSNSVYVAQQLSTEIIRYAFFQSDEDWVRIGNDLTVSSPCDGYVLTDDVLATVSYLDTGSVLSVVNPNTDSVLFNEAIDEGSEGPCYYGLLGTYKDKLYFVADINGDTSLKTLNLQAGKIEEVNGFVSDSFDCNMTFMKGSKIITLCTNDNFENYIDITNLEDMSHNDIKLPENVRPDIPMAYPDDMSYVFVSSYEKNLIIDTASGEITEVELPKDWEGTTAVAFNKEGNKIAITNGGLVSVLGLDGKSTISITTNGEEPTELAFYKSNKKQKNNEEILLVSTRYGFLNRYDINDGTLIGSTDSTVYTNYSGESSFVFPESGNNIYILSDKILSMIDTDSWQELTYIQNCFGYHEKTDHFMTLSYVDSEEMQIGYFKHYTNDELVAKGKALLQGLEMSDKLKSQYGIED